MIPVFISTFNAATTTIRNERNGKINCIGFAVDLNQNQRLPFEKKKEKKEEGKQTKKFKKVDHYTRCAAVHYNLMVCAPLFGLSSKICGWNVN